MTEHTQKFENLQQKQEAFTEELRPIQKQIEKYFQQTSKIVEIKSHLDKIENEKNLLEKQIKELLTVTKHCLFAGTDDELAEHVRNYESTTDKMRFDGEKAATGKIESLNIKVRYNLMCK